MKRHSARVRCVLWGLLMAAVPFGSTQAAGVKVANLQDLMQQAQRIFVGKCLAVEDGLRGNIPYTTYTFEVSDPLKGVSAASIEVRQFGLLAPVEVGASLARVTSIQGMPHYDRGKQYLLFLIEESPIGLSSPAGLFQGAFLLKGDGFVNSINNRNLTRNLSASWLREKGLAAAQVDRLLRLQEGAIDSRFFLEVVRRLSSGGAATSESEKNREP